MKLLRVLPSVDSKDSSSQKRGDLQLRSPVSMIAKGFSKLIFSKVSCNFAMKLENNSTDWFGER